MHYGQHLLKQRRRVVLQAQRQHRDAASLAVPFACLATSFLAAMASIATALASTFYVIFSSFS
eukprot:jgi/Chlat1/2863/Chrsp194S03008